jgi:hypothetical protein
MLLSFKNRTATLAVATMLRIYEMAVEAFVEISIQLLRFRPISSNSSIWIC